MTNVVGAPNDSESSTTLVPILRVERFTKHFAEVKANTDVSLDVLPGEVHALVGENGAGKSTLLKMIYGVYTPDSGRMLIDDTEVSLGSPAEARRLGIGMVFQDLRLVPALTVTENMALSPRRGRDPPPTGAAAKRIAAASEEYGLAVDPRALGAAPVDRRAAARRDPQGAHDRGAAGDPRRAHQRAGAAGGRRPCSASSIACATQGFGIVIVTHKLNEVRAIADR